MNPLVWFRHDRRRDELSEEIQSHIEEKTDELVARGLSLADAEREAHRAFGNVTSIKEVAGDVWRFETHIENVTSDVRHALRGLIQKPSFTIAVILTLALGIGANAVVFALVNALVLRPLPYPEADRLVSVTARNDAGHDSRALTDLAYVDWLGSTRSLVSSAAYEETQAVLRTSEGTMRITGLRATPSYFGILGVRPILGRTFDESEALPGGRRVVVLSEPFWRERFRGDSAVLGRAMVINDEQRFVIGVLPAWFTAGRVERFWLPMRVAPPVRQPNAESGEVIAFSVVARLRPEATLEGVKAEVATVMSRLVSQGYGFVGRTPVVMTLHERRHGETRRPLLLLFGAVGVLLLTACANIANLALARAARREREFALRLALGASRWRIVRFVLIENLALAAGGALLGLLVVTASLGWFVRISPDAIRSTEAIRVSGALVAYSFGIAILTALLFGLVPALTASRAAPNHTLASGTPRAAGSKRQSLGRRALVVGELAIALVFLTGAGLVAKTFWRVTSVDPGFRPEKLLAVGIELPEKRYTATTERALFNDLMSRVRREFGVQSVSYTFGAPMSGGGGTNILIAKANPRDTKWTLRLGEAVVDSAYFETIGARLVAGRFIGPGDQKGTQRVAVVTEDYVRRILKGAPALGTRIAGDGPTVVGVVQDIAQEPSDEERYPLIFTPLAQQRVMEMGLRILVRTTGYAEHLQARITQELQALDPLLPPPRFKTMERALAEVIAPRRFVLILLVAFAALAGGLAVIGLYSVLAYLVAERTREIGIRIAIGADPGRVTRMVLGHGLRFTIVGIVLGAMLSIAAVRVLRAWMYEMSVYDAPTFVAVAVLLGIVALVASWLPARRASRVDPVLALRAD